MAHYGDPEAHRCVLDEVVARPTAPRLIAYLRAAVMGSQGSDVGLQQLRRLPGALELPGPHLKVTLALLSLTVLASAAKPAFRKEQQRVFELLARERGALEQQGEQLKADGGPQLWAATSRAPSTPGHLASCDLGGPSANAAAAAVTGGGGGAASSALLNAGMSAAEAEAEEALTPLQRWEQAMDILNYCEAYANYLSGFTVLWYELFGPHYYYYDNSVGCASPGLSSDSGDSAAAAPTAATAGAGGPSAHRESGEWASSSSPSSPLPPAAPSAQGPQVPPHLYAVRWGEILTPQRRAWFQGLHNVVKEILVRILSRELPLELYALFIQYANLSLRVYLLQTLAEVFEWTSNYLDVLCYVHVMRRSYSVQCEMSELQRIWASFNLFDNRFIDDCREFNKMYTESQGAFSEQQVMVGPSHATNAAAVGGSGVAATAAAGAASSGNRLPSRVETAATLNCDGIYSGHRSPDSNEEENVSSATTAATAAVGTGAARRASPGFGSGDVSSAAASAADAALGGLHRIFPSRGAMGNASLEAADAAPSSASATSDDEALSSASEAAVEPGMRKAKRAVYLPLFYTSCCFTWILQRTFWSMYGRSSLLLESCLGSEVTPQVLRVGIKGAGTSETNALLLSTPVGARRRGVAAAAAGLTNAANNGSATPSAAPAHSRVSGVGGSARWSGATAATPAVPSAGAVAGGNGTSGDRRGGGALPLSPVSTAANNLSSSTVADGSVTSNTTATRGTRPPNVFTPPSSPSYAQTIAAGAVAAAPSPSLPNVASSALANTSQAAPAARASAAQGQQGQTVASSTWATLLGKLAHLRNHRSAASPQETTQGRSGAAPAVLPASESNATPCIVSSPPPTPLTTLPRGVVVDGPARSQQEAEERAAMSALLTHSGAPFHLQYTHRAREIQLYADPSVSFTGSGSEADADTLFFEEFHFLRATGCYVLSHALRNLTCYPRFPATLLILTDNTRRPGRVAWCDHKFSVLASPADDREERRGLTPWVLCAVIPNTRLSSDGAMRAQQEERLLQHVVFQVAGARSHRVRFCTANSVFFVLNGGVDMDGGRLYFALHLHVPESVSEGGAVSPEQVMREESKWAFRELGELHCSWAMSCTCNEALRVAFQVGPIDEVSA